MPTLLRLEVRPQGLQFTGRIEFEPASLWARYILPASGAVVWQCIGASGEVSWFRETVMILAC